MFLIKFIILPLHSIICLFYYISGIAYIIVMLQWLTMFFLICPSRLLTYLLNHDLNTHNKLQNKKQLLRMCCQYLEHKTVLQSLIKSAVCRPLLHVFEYENDEIFMQLLLLEALYGKYGLRCSAEYAQPVKQLLPQLKDLHEKLQSEATNQAKEECSKAVNVPRYARVNTLLTDMDEVHGILQEEGWTLASWSSKGVPKWKKYRRHVQALEGQNYLVDCHMAYVLIFPKGTDLHAHHLVTSGKLQLQDKASCLPVDCLSVPPGGKVLDACAAPGIKSFHMAATMNNKGRVFAFDRSNDRVKVMRQLMAKSGAQIVEVNNEDFLRTMLTADPRFSKVEYALVDPPCSGSGIVSRQDQYDDDNDADDNHRRLKSLSNLQAMLLKHAFRLPALKRLVYSTCSIEEQENEGVIAEILSNEKITRRFALIEAMPSWTLRGVGDHEFSHLVLRATPDKTLTNGFFVAVFERIKQDDQADGEEE